MEDAIIARLAEELGASARQAAAAVELLDGGATVPFIARYRKEATGGLDDAQLRTLEERLAYLRELEDRRKTVIDSITEQGKMTPALLDAVKKAEDKASLEDIYLPYRPKRRTKARIAAEAGLSGLASKLLSNPDLDPGKTAEDYLKPPFESADGPNPGVPDAASALDGARQILMEQFSEDAALAGELRAYVRENGILVSKAAEGKEEAGERFSDYFDRREPVSAIPSHRLLAMLRGRREEVLTLKLLSDEGEEARGIAGPQGPCEAKIAKAFGIKEQGRPADAWLSGTVRRAWRVKIFPRLETELMAALREEAENEAIAVFVKNLKALLLAAPAGAKVTMGLDPGIRTGVKAAVVDQTGKVLDTGTVYPHPPRNDWQGALDTLEDLAEKHRVELIAIGNGTASRETDRLAAGLLERIGRDAVKVTVSEAGASVYSASEYASSELPDMDVSLRGAVSIARRLQDPLAELVKIEPKSIGVGQYQHDVAQSKLARSLNAAVEDCVNAVGVDVNTASVPLLMHVSGLTEGIAKNIVAYRDSYGRFASRENLKKVPRFGEKTFEQAAGFLRITGGDNPLDASAVHPESYPIAEKILSDIGVSAAAAAASPVLLKKVRPEKYVSDAAGLPTVTDILKELEKPGRDPRPEFKSARFKEGIEEISDLKPGMILEGTVTNVTAFGAFVDIGVHQDGLVHISAMSEKFVSDPHRMVKTGQIVKVRVLDADPKRKRISLSMVLSKGADAAPPPAAGRGAKPNSRPKKGLSPAGGAMAEAFARLKRKI